MSDQNLLCSFCGLSKTQTNLLVAGQEAHICDSCIEQAYNIIIEESTRDEFPKQSQDHKISKPKEIKAFLLEAHYFKEYKHDIHVLNSLSRCAINLIINGANDY